VIFRYGIKDDKEKVEKLSQYLKERKKKFDRGFANVKENTNTEIF